jgi:hypothetical protein
VEPKPELQHLDSYLPASMILRRMKWKVGCDLNITEYWTMVIQVRIKLGKVKVKLALQKT